MMGADFSGTWRSVPSPAGPVRGVRTGRREPAAGAGRRISMKRTAVAVAAALVVLGGACGDAGQRSTGTVPGVTSGDEEPATTPAQPASPPPTSASTPTSPLVTPRADAPVPT